MKPLRQPNFSVPQRSEMGNCFATCVASILELPVIMVPLFMGKYNWKQSFHDWCLKQGYLDEWYYPEHRCIEHKIPYVPLPSDQYSIMSGTSPRNAPKGHSVVAFNGEMVHDPHPDDTGLLDLWDHIILRPIGARHVNIRGSVQV